MEGSIYVINYLRDLPIEAEEGDTYFVDESKELFTKPVYYVWKNGAWHIKYMKGECKNV